MNHHLLSALLTLLLILSAAGLRFHELGTWSFAGDELFTYYETRIWTGEIQAEELNKPSVGNYYDSDTMRLEDSQLARLPRLIPVAYAVHWLNYRLFGTDEFGARVLMAIIGSLNVGLVFLLARPLFGILGASVLAVFVLFCPEHLFNSQNVRMYALTYLLISVVWLLGGHITQNRSVRAAFWIGPCAILLVLCHSLGGLIWGGLLLGLAVDYVISRRTNEEKKHPKLLFSLIFLWSLILLGIAFWHILPLGAGWNTDRTWGYSPIHTLMAVVARIGWPIFLMSLVGGAYALFRIRELSNAYWSSVLLGSIGACLILPLVVTFYPWYSFLLTFPFFVLAARLVGQIRLLPGERESFVTVGFNGFVLIIAAALLNMPGTLSYYRDGNRLDFRSAYQYIAEHTQDGDGVICPFIGLAEYYLPDRYPIFPLRSQRKGQYIQETIEQASEKRLWIVCHSHRGGLENEMLCWLTDHAVLEAKFGRKRLDHIDNDVYVFLFDPEKTTGRPREP